MAAGEQSASRVLTNVFAGPLEAGAVGEFPSLGSPAAGAESSALDSARAEICVITPARTGLLRPGPRSWKRAVDLSCAAFLALVALPLAILIAAAIRLDSPGPVLFSHTRLGRGGRRFRLWKFRSMVVGADTTLDQYLRANPGHAREWSLTHKLRDDPRVTRVGRFLRKTSLDELPQLWNVLCGDLSMVGPRPIVAAETAKYGAALALYLQVLPGLTGLWQVSGRNDTHYRRRVELDCDYIRNWSPLLDLQVLLKTVRVILRGHGAY